MEKMARMLELWGNGVPTASVVEQALGISAERLDQDFRQWLGVRLERYDKQFIPLRRSPPLEVAKADAEKAPKNTGKQLALSLALYQAGKGKEADAALERALALEPKNLDANFLATQSALNRKDLASVRRHLDVLLRNQGDGYETRLVEAEWLTQTKDANAARSALEAAHRFDPSQAEPVARLAELARDNASEEIRWLEKLALLSQHEPPVYVRLLELLVQEGKLERAIEVGEAALHADMTGLETHLWFGRALAQKGDLKRAAFELESATLCQGPPAARAQAHRELAEVQTKLGQARGARENQKRAADLATEAASTN
jgi:tetratricopeptide (TPR) repeat protein